MLPGEEGPKDAGSGRKRGTPRGQDWGIGSLLLQRALTRLGRERPENLFAQLHSDLAKSAADAAATAFPGALLVNDLEHMFRNWKRHQSQDSRMCLWARRRFRRSTRAGRDP